MKSVTHYPDKWWAFIGISLLSFGCYLDYTVVNVALPTIQKDLETSLTKLQWIMNIYFLALCILATIMGRCGDIYGRRRLFYIGVNIFAIASLIAGFSSTIEWLIFGRFLQGVGAAIVLPLGPSLLPNVFPENERAKAIAWLGSLGGVALALGPMLGGVIVTYLSWRWVFFINIPIIILGYFFALKSVQESVAMQSNSALDWLGMILLALTMGGIVMGLIHSQAYGWLNWLTISYLLLGLVSGLTLFKVENNKDDPLIDFRDFSNLMFYSGAVLCFLAGVMSAVALFFDPLYLQIIRGESPEFSGFVLFAIPIAVFVVALMVGWFIKALGIVNTIIVGLKLAILGALFQLFFTPVSPLWFIILAFICLGSMWAMGNTVTLIAAQTAAGSHRSSVATGTMVTMFNVGGSIGLAISVVVYHCAGLSYLQHLLQSNPLFNASHFLQLEGLISNPEQSLKLRMTPATNSIFHDAFMQGFAGVMWFLLILSVSLLISIYLYKRAKKDQQV